MSVGQGLETSSASLSPTLGVPLESRYDQGDTDRLPVGKGSGGSGAMPIGASAVSIAVDQVIEKARRIAAELLEASVADITFDAGRFTYRRHRPFGRLTGVARAAHDPPVCRPARKAASTKGARSRPTAVTFPNGTHICEVEIDPDTGVTEVVRYTAVEELGRMLNPMLVAGQIHGGVVQGLGQAMGEQIVHDGHPARC